jgi:hypothetical protein
MPTKSGQVGTDGKKRGTAEREESDIDTTLCLAQQETAGSNVRG